MKKTKWWLFAFISMVCCTAVFLACKKEAANGNQVFLNQATFLSSQSLTLDAKNIITIGVSSTFPVDQDVVVSLAVDTAVVGAYNVQNNTKFKPVPKGYYELSSGKATIQAGSATGNVVLTVSSWPDYDSRSKYLIPVRITNASGGLPVLTASSIVYVILNKIVDTKAAIGQFSIPDLTGGVPPAEFTVEGSFKVVNANFGCNDPYSTRISTILVPDRALSVYSSAASEGNGSFRLRVGNSVDVNDITYGTPLQQGGWYHFAYTYKAGIFAFYVNGQLVGTKASAITPLTGTTQLGCGNNFAFSEVRVWSKARTQAQIVDNMCGTDPADPNLLAYWSFDKADPSNPTQVIDLTKKKFAAVKTGSGDIQFINGKCPH